jgi:hypothetical protein
MPITSWKIMVRRAEQTGYHYSATHKRGRAPSVGESIDISIGERQMRFTVTEVFKQHLAKDGFEVFTVMVDETEVFPETSPKSVGENL